MFRIRNFFLRIRIQGKFFLRSGYGSRNLFFFLKMKNEEHLFHQLFSTPIVNYDENNNDRIWITNNYNEITSTILRTFEIMNNFFNFSIFFVCLDPDPQKNCGSGSDPRKNCGSMRIRIRNSG